ncbi:OmpA family protein [Pseudoroseomonas globiformis]|uniref:OmpA family protein n=1 Tax=Teichococcus globiformis TaxID=2307229 RepID=A0ABV7G807_9PROT
MVPRLTAFAVLLPLLGACAPQGQPDAGTPTADTTARKAYPVYFEPWSGELDEPAREGLRQAAALARAHPQVPLRVIGFADPEGSPQANVTLSRLRAEIVSDELRRNGVAAERIRLEWRGAAGAAPAGLESRRVEIRIDGG